MLPIFQETSDPSNYMRNEFGDTTGCTDQ